ncbi:MAG TPA: NADH-quinone oxidoreductase subunit NuoE [Dehalococcoidia bacterium]|nr:NADH-quinone oxidoreductase subunit NuoE [Dehalococcoidia bacterium]
MEAEKVDEIIDRHPAKQEVLIQLLLDMQNEFNWIPKQAILRINERLQIPLSQIYRVASFYKAMSLTPRGKHIVNVCLGTACHVRGGPRIMDKVEESLKIKAGKTTQDMKFTLERVNCLGCCALGPVIVVDKDYYGNVTTAKVKEILESYD